MNAKIFVILVGMLLAITTVLNLNNESLIESFAGIGMLAPEGNFEHEYKRPVKQNGSRFNSLNQMSSVKPSYATSIAEDEDMMDSEDEEEIVENEEDVSARELRDAVSRGKNFMQAQATIKRPRNDFGIQGSIVIEPLPAGSRNLAFVPRASSRGNAFKSGAFTSKSDRQKLSQLAMSSSAL